MSRIIHPPDPFLFILKRPSRNCNKYTQLTILFFIRLLFIKKGRQLTENYQFILIFLEIYLKIFTWMVNGDRLSKQEKEYS
ncbi:hypothetical protein EMIT013CA1_20141 [Bacillus sp. IT-13CA1]